MSRDPPQHCVITFSPAKKAAQWCVREGQPRAALYQSLPTPKTSRLDLLTVKAT